MKKIHILFAVLILVLSACKKDDSPLLRSVMVGEDPSLFAYSGKINYTLEKPIGIKKSYNIDIDNNGFDDISFSIENYNNPITISQKITIKPLSESVYISFQNVDNVMCKSSNLSGDTTWYEDYDSTKTYDSIVYIYNDHNIHPMIYSERDRIGVNDDFSNETTDIAYIYYLENTIENYDIKYEKWLGKKNKYIGVKIVNKNYTYLGWIKLDIVDYNKVKLYDYYLRLMD